MEKVADYNSSEWSSRGKEDDIEATLTTVGYLGSVMSPKPVCKLPVEGIVGSSSWGHVKSHFVGMGFSAAMVDKAIEENGEEDADLLLETLLTYSALEKFNSKFPDVGINPVKDEFPSIECASSNVDWEIEDADTLANDRIGSKTSLLMMKFSEEEIDLAINKLGAEVPIRELADLIIANQIAAQTSKGTGIELSQDRLLAKKGWTLKADQKLMQLSLYFLQPSTPHETKHCCLLSVAADSGRCHCGAKNENAWNCFSDRSALIVLKSLSWTGSEHGK